MANPRAGPFSRFAAWAARKSGHGFLFVAALTIIVAWAASGPLFKFTNTWQLVINSFTTIVTFLMVFLIQNAQTRDNEAVQITLDELIRATKRTRTELLDLEELPEEELHRIQQEYEGLAGKARAAKAKRKRRGP